MPHCQNFIRFFYPDLRMRNRNGYELCFLINMKTATICLLFFSLTAQDAWAKSSCDIYFKASQIQKSAESFDKIASFFGFQNGKKTFEINFKEGQTTQYWTALDGKVLEQATFISNYRGKIASLELNKSIRGDWNFNWTIEEQGSSSSFKVSEIIFESKIVGKTMIPDSVISDGSKLTLTRSTVRKNQNSKVVIVMNHTMHFLKNEDGTIELTSTLTSDSIKENTILIGDETEYTLNLKER